MSLLLTDDLRRKRSPPVTCAFELDILTPLLIKLLIFNTLALTSMLEASKLTASRFLSSSCSACTSVPNVDVPRHDFSVLLSLPSCYDHLPPRSSIKLHAHSLIALSILSLHTVTVLLASALVIQNKHDMKDSRKRALSLSLDQRKAVVRKDRLFRAVTTRTAVTAALDEAAKVDPVAEPARVLANVVGLVEARA